MNAVEQHLWKLDEPQRSLALILRDCLLAASPTVTEKIAWNVPFFHYHGSFAYLNPLKGGGIDVCFTRGILLDDRYHLLERRQRQQIASVVIASLDDLEAKADALGELLRQAIRLNETHHKPRLSG